MKKVLLPLVFSVFAVACQDRAPVEEEPGSAPVAVADGEEAAKGVAGDRADCPHADKDGCTGDCADCPNKSDCAKVKEGGCPHAKAVAEADASHIGCPHARAAAEADAPARGCPHAKAAGAAD